MRKQFDFYGYNSPTNGKFYVNDCLYTYGEDYRNAKRYKEYKDLGLNILLLQHENSYNGEPFENSDCKLCMDEALKANLNKVIVSDTRIKDLCVVDNLVGDNSRFSSVDELLDYLDECTKPYRFHKAFFGLQLYDEPERTQLKSYSLVIKALRKLIPNIYLQCNLLPAAAGERLAGKGVSSLDGFKSYIKEFLKLSNFDSVTYDEYPFRRDYIIGGYSIPSYQIAADICKEYGVEYHMVIQSWAWIWQNSTGSLSFSPRQVFERDVYWQMNLLMGLGCVDFGFFTYMPKQHIDISPKVSIRFDGCCLLNLDGTRTKLYYSVKKIIKEMNKFAPVILKYKYNSNYLFFESGKTKDDFMQTKFAIENKNCPINVAVSSGIAFVTELINGEDKLYMIQNIGNISDDIWNKKEFLYRINVGSNYSKINIYKNGNKIKHKLTKGVFAETLAIGDAVFIELKY